MRNHFNTKEIWVIAPYLTEKFLVYPQQLPTVGVKVQHRHPFPLGPLQHHHHPILTEGIQADFSVGHGVQCPLCDLVSCLAVQVEVVELLGQRDDGPGEVLRTG